MFKLYIMAQKNETQNLKYQNYIAITNQLLIIHDILHDFSPSSNKARLSKSTNLIKQTILYVTDIKANALTGGMPRTRRRRTTQNIGRSFNGPHLSRNEKNEIIEFFTMNLLPARLFKKIIELKGKTRDEFMNKCFVYRQYIKPLRAGIMSRSARAKYRLYTFSIKLDEIKNITEEIQKSYLNSFLEIYNTNLSFSHRRSLRIASQRPDLDLVDLFCIISNIRNNWSIDNYFMNSKYPDKKGIEGNFITGVNFTNIPSSILNKISNILISFVDNYDILISKILSSDSGPILQDFTEEDYAHVVMNPNAMFGGQRGGAVIDDLVNEFEKNLIKKEEEIVKTKGKMKEELKKQLYEAEQRKREEDRTAAKADSGSDFSIEDWMAIMEEDFLASKKKILDEVAKEEEIINKKIEEELEKITDTETAAARRAKMIQMGNKVESNAKRWRKKVTALSLEEQVNRPGSERGESKFEAGMEFQRQMMENELRRQQQEEPAKQQAKDSEAKDGEARAREEKHVNDDEVKGEAANDIIQQKMESQQELEKTRKEIESSALEEGIKMLEGMDEKRKIGNVVNQILPNIKLTDIHKRQLIYNRQYNGLIHAFDVLMSSYSQINDIDDLILLNFVYVIKTSFVVYKNLQENEIDLMTIFQQQEYKNMVFIGFLLITLNAIQVGDYFFNEKEDPFLITENFIDIITNDLIDAKLALKKTTVNVDDEDYYSDDPDHDVHDSKVENGQPKETKGGGMSIIQKGGNVNDDIIEEANFLVQPIIDQIIQSTPPPQIQNAKLDFYLRWLITSIGLLTSFKSQFNQIYEDDYKNLLKNALSDIKTKIRAEAIFNTGFSNIFVNKSQNFIQMKNWINQIQGPLSTLNNKVLGIPMAWNGNNNFRVGSSLFNNNAFENLKKFIQPFNAQADLTATDNGVNYEIDLELFVKFPIRWIFLNAQQRGRALAGWRYFYDIVSNYDQPHNQNVFRNDPLVIRMYTEIDGPQQPARRIRAKRVIARLLYEPMDTLIAQIKGFFTNSSSKSPPSYLGYRIDQRQKNLEKKRKQVLSMINLEVKKAEKQKRIDARRAAQEAKGRLTGDTQSFADHLTQYIAIMGLDKMTAVFNEYFLNYKLSHDALNYNDKPHYWATIISRYCISYDEWKLNLDAAVTRLRQTANVTDPFIISTIKNMFPMGNHENANSTQVDEFIQQYSTIDIGTQLVRKICGLELYCIAQAAGYFYEKKGQTSTHFILNHRGSTLGNIVPGNGSLDERLRTGMEDILTNSYRGHNKATPFNSQAWNTPINWNEDGKLFSLNDVKENMLIYGRTEDIWKSKGLVLNKFKLTQSPLNTRYIINNAADLKNLIIPYQTQNMKTKFYPNTPAEKNRIFNDANVNNICTTSSIVDKQPQCTYNVAETKKNRLSLNTRFELLPAQDLDNISYIGNVINKHRINGEDQNGMVVLYNIDLLWLDFNIHINKVINIETGADLKAPLVYENVLEAIRNYNDENIPHPRVKSIKDFWANKRNDDIFFNKILTNILVKSQGDMIQEINATFKYGAMENMEDWQKDLTKSTPEEKDKYKMVTANPDLVTNALNPNPFRIGISNDQPAGVRKVLYNLYSILGMTYNTANNRAHMNLNNISGYFGGTNTFMLRANPGSKKVDIGFSPAVKPRTAFVGGKRRKKTKRKRRKKKRTKRRNKRKKKTKRRRKKRKQTRRKR